MGRLNLRCQGRFALLLAGGECRELKGLFHTHVWELYSYAASPFLRNDEKKRITCLD
jgi:hypothetical protein